MNILPNRLLLLTGNDLGAKIGRPTYILQPLPSRNMIIPFGFQNASLAFQRLTEFLSSRSKKQSSLLFLIIEFAKQREGLFGSNLFT